MELLRSLSVVLVNQSTRNGKILEDAAKIDQSGEILFSRAHTQIIQEAQYTHGVYLEYSPQIKLPLNMRGLVVIVGPEENAGGSQLNSDEWLDLYFDKDKYNLYTVYRAAGSWINLEAETYG